MWPCKLAAFKCDPVKTYLFDIDKNTFETVVRYLNIWQLFDSTKQNEGEIQKIQNLKQMMSGILYKSWLGEVIAGWYFVRKLNAFIEHYLAQILLLLWEETLVQETNYLALHFCYFFGIMLHRNLRSVNC